MRIHSTRWYIAHDATAGTQTACVCVLSLGDHSPSPNPNPNPNPTPNPGPTPNPDLDGRPDLFDRLQVIRGRVGVSGSGHHCPTLSDVRTALPGTIKTSSGHRQDTVRAPLRAPRGARVRRSSLRQRNSSHSEQHWVEAAQEVEVEVEGSGPVSARRTGH